MTDNLTHDEAILDDGDTVIDPAETVEGHEPLSSSDFPDLSALPGSELRKLTEIVTVNLEAHGNLYASIFRQLQIRPEKYAEFHNGVVRAIRVKHNGELKRGSDASIKALTGYLLRAFGYIVWKPGSDWVIDEKELENGENRLIYRKGRSYVVDDRFEPIFKSLWQKMRNVVFAPRTAPVRRGRPNGMTSILPSAAVTVTDGEDSYMGDVDSESHLPSPHERARATASGKIKSLAEQVAKRLPPTMQRWKPEQTEQALVGLVSRLCEIRHSSDPQVFEELWQAQIMRLEELEHEEGQDTGPPAKDNPTAITMASNTNISSPSNEPFASSGNPVPHSFPSTPTIPPTLPALMSVYISVSRLAPSSLTSTPSAAPALTNAYHWPGAPVQNHSFEPFFRGVLYRMDVAPSRVLG